MSLREDTKTKDLVFYPYNFHVLRFKILEISDEIIIINFDTYKWR